jgi:hypothetical protein
VAHPSRVKELSNITVDPPGQKKNLPERGRLGRSNRRNFRSRIDCAYRPRFPLGVPVVTANKVTRSATGRHLRWVSCVITSVADPPRHQFSAGGLWSSVSRNCTKCLRYHCKIDERFFRRPDLKLKSTPSHCHFLYQSLQKHHLFLCRKLSTLSFTFTSPRPTRCSSPIWFHPSFLLL